MTIPVYSKRFVQLHGLNGTHVYTCTAGVVTVLRDVDAYYGGTGVLQNVLVIGANGQAIWEFNPAVLEPSYGSWRGRQVFYAGETITFSTGDATDITASGYELLLP